MDEFLEVTELRAGRRVTFICSPDRSDPRETALIIADGGEVNMKITMEPGIGGYYAAVAARFQDGRIQVFPAHHLECIELAPDEAQEVSDG